ncbi:MAG: hypothetical protein HY366_00060 [Candidatus Aenigmarchaeota archaeon]|nr:hypothetical protein [Candidatus Aenigmarchaeota archaeon]
MAGVEEIPICRLCVEPVFYSVCPDCLFADINRWLEDKAPFIAIEVNAAHDSLVGTFPKAHDNKEFCVRCKDVTHNVICPYCYIREIYHELRLIDEFTAEELLRDFNFDFENNGYFGELPWTPVELRHVHASAGMCERCDNDSETLYSWEGEYRCINCLEGEDDFMRTKHG